MTVPELSPDEVLEFLKFDLLSERIAQTGAEPRDSSRLMVVGEQAMSHRIFHDLPALLRPDDLLVFNESRVIPARVMAHKPAQGGMGGGRVEVMLLRQEPSEGEGQVWSAYLKPARRAGHELWLGERDPVRAEVVGVLPDGARLLCFAEDLWPHLERIGTLPLPPYISSDPAQFADRLRHGTRQRGRPHGGPALHAGVTGPRRRSGGRAFKRDAARGCGNLQAHHGQRG